MHRTARRSDITAHETAQEDAKKAAGKAAAAAAGAPGPRSDNGVDDSDPEAVIPLDSPRSMDGASPLHIEEVDYREEAKTGA